MARTSRHLVVDGSNIATEGRTVPSLVQLDEAVRAIQAEEPDRTITVIVDATFAHRIDSSERPAFEEASDNGEILMPPAGAVGRGDAFILQVAEKADAAVLSNDSFQEFHGEHPWLFDDDRLIGGKPIEGVGWVFVPRVPVRGPASRRATRKARTSAKKATKRSTRKKVAAKRAKASKAAQGPPPVPTSDTPPPAGRRRRSGTKVGERDDGASTTTAMKQDGGSKRGGSRRRKVEELNSPRDFLGFVAQHSIGDEVEAVVERFSSHGCYVRSVGAQCYLPSSAMGDPPPNRARDVVSLGQTAIVRVESLDSDRRGINVELVRVVTDDVTEPASSSGRSRRRKQDQTSQPTATVADDSAGEANPTRSDTTVATKKSAKKATKKAAKKATKKAPAQATASARAAKATARKAAKKAGRKTTKKAAARKSTKKATKRTAAKKTAKKATKKSAAKRTTKKATRKAAKKAGAGKATKRAAAKKTAKKATKKSAAKRTTKKATRKAAKKATRRR